jgi:hypothetical protein
MIVALGRDLPVQGSVLRYSSGIEDRHMERIGRLCFSATAGDYFTNSWASDSALRPFAFREIAVSTVQIPIAAKPLRES